MKDQFCILIIEDEAHIRSFMTKMLSQHAYRVIACCNGREGLSSAAACYPDIILLDLGLPDIDGIDIIQKIRSWSDCPIIVISARSQEQEKVEALDLGADDYLTKPFGSAELLARIRTSLRHSHKLLPVSGENGHSCYHALDLVIDFEKHLVLLDNQPLHLTPVEYRIVTFLAQSSGKVLTYRAIMEHVWGPYIENDNKILRVNMANIRRKLEKNPGEPQYIFTELGVGYRMLEDEQGIQAGET